MSSPAKSTYTEASIKTLCSLEHIRLRPGMYIGRLGNGAHAEDGIYVLLKETIDNSIDEFTMGHGRKIEVELDRTQRQGPRLRPRHPAREARGVRLDHQHGRQIRQRDLPEGGGAQRRRPEGRQRPLARTTAPRRSARARPRWSSSPRASSRASRASRRPTRTQRHADRVHAGRGALRQGLQVPHRVRRGHALELRVPEPRASPSRSTASPSSRRTA